MQIGNKPDISELLRDHRAVERVLSEAAREAVLRHKRLGESIVVWQDGRVVVIPPEEIPEDGVAEPPEA